MHMHARGSRRRHGSLMLQDGGLTTKSKDHTCSEQAFQQWQHPCKNLAYHKTAAIACSIVDHAQQVPICLILGSIGAWHKYQLLCEAPTSRRPRLYLACACVNSSQRLQQAEV